MIEVVGNIAKIQGGIYMASLAGVGIIFVLFTFFPNMPLFLQLILGIIGFACAASWWNRKNG